MPTEYAKCSWPQKASASPLAASSPCRSIPITWSASAHLLGIMYGLILEGIAYSVRQEYGDEVWLNVKKKASVKEDHFVTKKPYSETIIPRLIKIVIEITGKSQEEILEVCGKHFVHYVDNFGYDKLVKVMGRNLREFLNGLDNLHEYIRVTYPKLKPPSFFCDDECTTGLTLHYRSRRKGFTWYVVGQMKEVARSIYNTPVKIEILEISESLTINHVKMRLEFDNSAFEEGLRADTPTFTTQMVSYNVLSEIFPFHVVFGTDMIIKSLGEGIAQIMPKVTGQAVDETFQLVRPAAEFTMETIKLYSNNCFELLSTQGLRRDMDSVGNTVANTLEDLDDWTDDGTNAKKRNRRLKLKGQMICMPTWNAVLFLGTPMMSNLATMMEMGIFINDLSMHDSSRELVLASTQQQTELNKMLEQEKVRSKSLEQSMQALDAEMKRTDALLYQMIPKAVAERLRSGEPAMNTCQIFESVTILFTDVVGFTSICSNLTPMMVVDMLNEMYSRFDRLTVKHRVYKVETIGDAYMVVSGAPLVTKFHAVYISSMAFDMVESMRDMQDPSKEPGPDSSMKIRVGIHTGPVVGGVVGLKMPRYCLVGENVHIANTMESSGAPLRVHISETTRRELAKYPFTVEVAEPVKLKSGHSIRTFWLTGKDPNSSVKIPMAANTDEGDDLEGNTND